MEVRQNDRYSVIIDKMALIHYAYIVYNSEFMAYPDK